jgi:hypothetical protein
LDTSVKRACQLLLDTEEIAELHVTCTYFIHSFRSIHAMTCAALFTVANCIVTRFATLSAIWTFIHYDVAHGYFLLVGGCFGDVVITALSDASDSYRLGITFALRSDVLIHWSLCSPHPKATSFGGDESSPCHLVKEPANLFRLAASVLLMA